MALEQPRKGITLFGKPKSLPEPSPEFLEQVNTLSSRLRILEERNSNLNRKIEVIEANMLRNQKQVNTELKTISSDVTEIRRQVEALQDKLELVIRELKNFASSDDVEVLKKYIDMWEPMNFATKSEVQKIVKEMLGKG
jgi:predicted  nucleic acid-binding Zn-ribbon protein